MAVVYYRIPVQHKKLALYESLDNIIVCCASYLLLNMYELKLMKYNIPSARFSLAYEISELSMFRSQS